MVERERRYSLDADLAAGRRTLRDLTRAEYVETVDVLDQNEGARLIGYFGWMPVAITAIVAGIVVAFVSGVWWLFLLTALVGTFVGYVAMIGAWIIYYQGYIRWLRLGNPQDAATVILLSVGPAAALLVAALLVAALDLNFGLLVAALDLNFGLPDVPPFSIPLMMLVLWAIGDHYFSDERHRH